MAFPHKREKIAETVRGWLASGRYKPGDRFPSDQELARRFRVTHVTVRGALKPLVEEGVLERRIGFGTIVRKAGDETAASSLATAVGLVLPDNTHSFFAEVLHAVEAALQPTGRPLVLGHTSELAERERALIDRWREQGLERLLLVPASGEAARYRRLLEDGVRLVLVDREVAGVDAPAITTRDDDGARAIVRLLIGLGHRRLVHLAGPASASTAKARRAAFEAVCAEAKVSGTVVSAGFFIEDGERAMRALLARGGPVPEAVFAANDPVAVGAMRALAERGLEVPRDVRVAGYGDTDLGRSFQLTSVRQFPERMGAEAVRLLLAPGEVSARDSVRLEPEVVVRRSTGG